MNDATSTAVIDTEALRHHRGMANPAIQADTFTGHLGTDPETGVYTCYVLQFITVHGMPVTIGVYSSAEEAEVEAQKFIGRMPGSRVYRHAEEPEFRYKIEKREVPTPAAPPSSAASPRNVGEEKLATSGD